MKVGLGSMWTGAADAAVTRASAVGTMLRDTCIIVN